MTGDLGTWIVFALGVIVGGVFFSKEFRVKFFTSLRGFLGQLGRGARQMNDQYAGGARARRESSERVVQPRLEIQHVYKQTHSHLTCSTCQGSGRVYKKSSPLQEGALGYKPTAIVCPDCEGEGKVWD